MPTTNATAYPRFARIPTVAESEECRQVLELLAQEGTPQSTDNIAAAFQTQLGLTVRKRVVADYLQKCGWTGARERQDDGHRRRVWLPPAQE